MTDHKEDQEFEEYLAGKSVAPFVEGYLDGKHEDILAVWRLYTAWRWMDIFRPA